MGNIGNTFVNENFSVGRAKKVWRELHDIYPGGGVLANLADWGPDADGNRLIPAGTPVCFKINEKVLYAYNSEVYSQHLGEGENPDPNVINGYLQEDIYIPASAVSTTVVTGTVVYRGEMYGTALYEYNIFALQKVVPGVVFVN